MSNKNYDCKFLEWDTDYFGVNSARVNLSGIVDKNGQEDIIDFCNSYDFVTISNTDNVSENNNWIGNKTNAFLADMNIQFLKVLGDNENYKYENTYVLNYLSKNDKIVDIAKRSFNHSRFFNDQKLPKEKSENIYIHWTKCAFLQKDKYFVISEKDGIIAGYILFSFSQDSSVIELIAVDKRYQGQKIGKLMIGTMESFVINKRIKKIKVGTQANNISAIQFYNAMGFKYVSCASIYHLWRL